MSRSVKIGESTVSGVVFDQFECFVGDDPEKGVKGERVTYNTPKTAQDFQRMVSGATGDDLVGAWNAYCYGWGLKARATGRPESGGVVLPVISTKKRGRLNLVTGEFDGVIGAKKAPAPIRWTGTPVPLEARVKMINAAILSAAATEDPVPRGVMVAREQLISAKLVSDDRGVLKVVPTK